WTEVSSGNPPGDRLFLQSAGPFTLQPGDYNNVTVGLVFARATGGEPFESVELLRLADDKAQALFDNCFEIVSGPDAPDVTVQELDQEVILYLSNENPISNNFQESYVAFDPSIVAEQSDGTVLDSLDRSYFFQGYQIYQLKDQTVSPSDLGNVELARLIRTVDIADSIGVVINYLNDAELGVPVPELMANGENEGIQHSFSFETDAFAQGDTRLINYKTYYYMVLAYGYNNYSTFDPVTGQGQDVQYKASRKSPTGSIRVYSAIPHPPASESGGTASQSQYGDGIALTRIEGKGNGNNILALSEESEKLIVDNYSAAEVTYQPGLGPVNVKVIDPLNIKAGDFELQLNPDNVDLDDADEVFWTLTNLTMLNDNDVSNDDDAIYESIQSIDLLNEEIFLDWGISVSWQQTAPGGPTGTFIDLLDSRIVFDDASYPWLQGIPDRDENSELNWIRSGNVEASDDSPEEEVVFNDAFDTTTSPDVARDGDEIYEGVIDGTWAPYVLVSYTSDVTFQGATSPVQFPLIAPTTEELRGPVSNLYSTIEGIHNVDVVFTSDRDQWTRCPVLEMQPNPDLAQDADGNDDVDPEKMRLRRHPSVDKNGLWNSSQDGYNQEEATLGGAQPIGMGWFPGYAIDLGTGERLNMAFGEDSWLSLDNGDDMIYNPSSRLESSLGNQVFGGGQHWVYVFKNSQKEEENDTRMPGYDEGAYMYDALEA
ncbi:MAG: hypothetical protein HRT74_12745, partial [Flavobacteriales bacterium]|nr:hypothetical protein [Flavobacteriales bacterium]